MFRNDLAHSGVYSAAGVPKLKGIKWAFHTRGEVVSSPAIVDGVIYVGSNDGNLYAIDQQTGTKNGHSQPGRVSLRRLPLIMASSTSAATTATFTQ